jgi:hypothetical protein
VPPGPPASAAADTVESPAPSINLTGGEALRRSTSASGQFVVYADSLDLRGRFCIFAETIRKQLYTFLGASGSMQWSSPIVIRIVRDDENPDAPDRGVHAIIRPYDFGGWLLQLEIFLDAVDFSREHLEEELIRLLLAERILHHADPEMIEQRRQRILPDWLHHGIVGVIRYRLEGRPSDTFLAVWKAGNPLDIDAILDGEHARLDGLSRRVFEASSTGLVHALQRQRQGRLCLRQLIGNLGREELAARAQLAKYFPELNASADAIAKWWALEMAALAEGSAFERLSAKQTETRLAEILTITFIDQDRSERQPGLLASLLGRNRSTPSNQAGNTEAPATSLRRSIDLRDIAELDEHPRREAILLNEVEDLLALNLRSFPLYQPIIAAYVELVSAASQGKRIRQLAAHLSELEGWRESVLTRVERSEHLLDYLEATQTRHVSSQFDDYLRLMESFEVPIQPRSDAISRYLDAIEDEWR